MRPYVELTWGQWDDPLQEEFFRRNFSSETVQIISMEGQDAGLLNVEREADEIFLANLQILPCVSKSRAGFGRFARTARVGGGPEVAGAIAGSAGELWRSTPVRPFWILRCTASHRRIVSCAGNRLEPFAPGITRLRDSRRYRTDRDARPTLSTGRNPSTSSDAPTRSSGVPYPHGFPDPPLGDRFVTRL